MIDHYKDPYETTSFLGVKPGCLEEGCSVEEIEKIQTKLERDEGIGFLVFLEA